MSTYSRIGPAPGTNTSGTVSVLPISNDPGPTYNPQTGIWTQTNSDGSVTTYGGAGVGVGGLMEVTRDPSGNIVANPPLPTAVTQDQANDINYLNKSDPGKNYRAQIVDDTQGNPHTVIVSGDGGAGNVWAGDYSGAAWANDNNPLLTAAGNGASNSGPLDPKTGEPTWVATPGSNGGVSWFGNLIGKTAIPVGEALGLLPAGSTKGAAAVQAAADAARAAGLPSVPIDPAVANGASGPASTVANGPALAAAITAAQNQADAAQAASNNYQPISAPTIGYAPAAQAGQATAGVSQGYGATGGVSQGYGATGGVSQGYAAAAGQVGAYQAAPYTAPIQAGHATAGVATAAQIASTALAAKQQAIVAQQIQAALVAQQPAIQAQQVTAAQAGRTIVGPTALADQSQIAPVDLAGNTTIDQGESEQARAAQTNLIGQLQGTIAGTSPSVAAIMLRQETERNIASQYALGAAASAQNSGLAQRTAMINAANLNQQAIGQQALLRAQEIATAQGLLGTTAGAERTSDINVATSQADLSQQVILANAGFTNTQNMTQAQLDQAVKLANAGFKNTATTTQAQLDQATAALNVTQANTVNLANAKNALDAATTNVTLAQQAMLANQSAENAARLANAQNALAAATTNAQLAQQVELQNAAAINQTNTTNATLSTNTSIANAGYSTQASIDNANNVTSANTASAQLANAISIANANNQSQMQISQAADTTNANIATAGNLTQSSVANAKNATDASIATAGNFTQSSVANAKNATDAGIASAQNYTSSSENNATNATNASENSATNATNASINTATLANAVNINNASNAVTTAGQNITAKQNAAGNAITAEGNVISGQVGMANAANGAVNAAANVQAANNNDPSNPFNILKSYAQATSGSSDRRGKKDIKDAEMDVKKLVASLSAKSFHYKDTSKPGTAPGRRWGVMAQDLEKSKAGKSLVHDTPNGKMVDTSQAVLTALAAISHVAKRIDKIEKRVSR